MNIDEKRHYAIDYAKAIGIYLVILGHLEISSVSSVEHDFIYSFHMPLFFFLSGILFNVNYHIKERVALSFKKLMVPYFWFSFISFLSLPFILNFFHMNDLSFHNLGKQLFLALSGVMYGAAPSLDYIYGRLFWFLPCLFFIQVFYSCIAKSNQILLFTLVVCWQFMIPILATSVNPFLPYNRLIMSMDSAFIGIFFFHLGALFNKKHLTVSISKINELLLLSAFLISSALLITLLLFFPTNFDIASISQGNYPFLSYLLAMLGITLVFTLSVIFEKMFKQSDFIEFISRNTVTIFATHIIVIKYIHRLEILLNTSFDFINKFSYLYALLVVFICMALACVVENWLPFLISKKRHIPKYS